MKTEFEVIKELTKGKMLKHFAGFFVKFNDDGKLVYSHNKISWGKRTGEVNFENPDQWQVEPEVIEKEVTWFQTSSGTIYPTLDRESQVEFFKPLIGKRTKVRIEVLGDE